MPARMIQKTVIVDLKLSRTAREQVRILSRHQSQTFNLGIDRAFEAMDAGEPIPSNFTAYKEILTPKRGNGELPLHSLLLQRAGLRAGLDAMRKARSKLGKYRTSLERLSKDLMKARKKDNTKEIERLERIIARVEHKLERLESKGRDRFYRKRKDAERTKMPAVVFLEGAKVSETHVKLPGGLQLKFRKPFIIEEGYTVTGAVQIVDATRKPTRRTLPCHRRFRAHISIKKPAPETVAPETEDELLGIDMGIVAPVYTSTGKKIDLKDAELEAKADARIKYLNRCISRCDPGSRRYKKLSRIRKKAWAKRTNRRKNASRHAAKEVTVNAQDEGCVGVVAEKLNHLNMRASAKGTVKHPGKNVAAKRGLNNSLGRAALGRLQDDIERRCLIDGIDYSQVPAPGTSQQCHACGTKGGRETQAIFLCSHCGWFGNADLNAARNIRARGWAALGTNVVRHSGVINKRISKPKQTTLQVL